jgi:hypothetical protein
MYRFYWRADADADPRSPNPFACTPVEERCTHSSECCEPLHHGGACYVDPHSADAGPDDAGQPSGVCGDSEENHGSAELP